MASIYEKPPHFVLEKTWDKKTRLPETFNCRVVTLEAKSRPKATKTVEVLV